MESRKEAVTALDSVLKDVMRTNDKNMKQVKNLEMVLLNLKIESSRHNECATIEPIADRLELITREIEKEVKQLIDENRNIAKEAIKMLMEEENV